MTSFLSGLSRAFVNQLMILNAAIPTRLGPPTDVDSLLVDAVPISATSVCQPSGEVHLFPSHVHVKLKLRISALPRFLCHSGQQNKILAEIILDW